jgi:hypothetical protein
MGIFDSLSGLLKGSGKEPEQVELLPDEVERARVVATWNPGSLRSVGGDLVLTNQRLIFTPLNVTDLVGVLAWALSKAGAPPDVDKIPGQIGKLITQHVLKGSQSIEPSRGPSLSRGPTVIIRGADGSATEVAIFASRLTPSFSRKNVEVRDAFIATVRAELAK